MTAITRLGQDFWDFSDLVLKTRFMQAIEDGVSRYPINRSLRFAVREDLEALFDRMAMQLGWRAQRLHASSLILDSEGLFITAEGSRKADYCSCAFAIWADTPDRAEQAKSRIEALAAANRMHEPMFSIDWHFLTAKGMLESASIEELADDILIDSAYPEVPGGVNTFIARYLAARETVLVVQGPPGTGKTRLIRAILGAISRRNDGRCRALYTGDNKTMESDEIFVRFITGWEDAFVVEDADHLLKPRADGNENLHRFLAIADGVVRAQGRKIIFSTNLPNVGDLDDALIRPGRCFARLNCRELTIAEAHEVIEVLSDGDSNIANSSAAKLGEIHRRSISLAAVYQIIEKSQSAVK